MNHSRFLSEIQLEEIRKLAEKTRHSLGFVGDTPIANDIFIKAGEIWLAG